MINFRKLIKQMQWNIVAGTILLIIAFSILITSNQTADSLGRDSSDKSPLQTTHPCESANETTNVSSGGTDTTDALSPFVTNLIPGFSQSETTKNTDKKTTFSVEGQQDIKKRTRKKTAVSKKRIDFQADHPFVIRVNRAKNFTVVYAITKKGHYMPYKAFVCSTGEHEGYTPLGTFEISDKYRWHLMVDDTYAQYAIRIEGQIMLHSIPYIEPSSDSLEYWEYNKLGQPASLGCVRFRVSDVRWIYKHCNAGTQVTIYSKPDEECPLKLPKIKKLKASNPKSVWDPTDPSPVNPWKKNRKKQRGN